MRSLFLSLFFLACTSSSPADGGDGGGGGGGGDGGGIPGSGNFFPAGAPWTTDISGADTSPMSDEIIDWLDGEGWGGGQMQIDFSIDLLVADSSTPRRSFETTDDFFDPDCDDIEMPIPEGGNLEGESGYACDNDGDCHLLVIDRGENRLYEMWRANIEGGTFYGGCLASWDLSRSYPETLRGDQCSSADAAGFPIAPLTFTADEVASGEIAHAIRFILPNARMRDGVYVRPATHAGAPRGPDSAPPYGVRFRLRADYPLESLPNDGARVVAKAMQRYGMFLADGGTITLTAMSDRHTVAKWRGLLEPRDLTDIQPSDFEVLEFGQVITQTYDCVRN
ncbi:MAG: hypothetical protein JKY56_21070 [Kofleriaceae bacterium]|nr:hypothetical protein [Kofleriaceae bacterium]